MGHTDTHIKKNSKRPTFKWETTFNRQQLQCSSFTTVKHNHFQEMSLFRKEMPWDREHRFGTWFQLLLAPWFPGVQEETMLWQCFSPKAKIKPSLENSLGQSNTFKPIGFISYNSLASRLLIYGLLDWGKTETLYVFYRHI